MPYAMHIQTPAHAGVFFDLPKDPKEKTPARGAPGFGKGELQIYSSSK
jgi:hypothetical protein